MGKKMYIHFGEKIAENCEKLIEGRSVFISNVGNTVVYINNTRPIYPKTSLSFTTSENEFFLQRIKITFKNEDNAASPTNLLLIDEIRQ